LYFWIFYILIFAFFCFSIFTVFLKLIIYFNFHYFSVIPIRIQRFLRASQSLIQYASQATPQASRWLRGMPGTAPGLLETLGKQEMENPARFFQPMRPILTGKNILIDNFFLSNEN